MKTKEDILLKTNGGLDFYKFVIPELEVRGTRSKNLNTPEALNELHSNNKRGLGLYKDELIGWLYEFNRYHKGSLEKLP